MAERQRPMAAVRAEIAEPKRPGRTPGAGTFRSREAPRPEASTERPVDVQVSLDACPAGGGPREAARVDWADRPAWPARPRLQVPRDCVGGWRGTGCGPQVRGPHPDGALGQSGATAHRLGPRLLAAAPGRPDGVGRPGRHGPAGLAALLGGQRTHGALRQDALRRALGARGPAYAPWRGAVPAAPVVPTDAPGWRVGGEPASGLAGEPDAAPVAQVRPRPRHAAGPEVSPTDDEGGRVPARRRRDEARACEGVDPHECRAPLLRSSDDGLATKRGRARDCGAPRQALVPAALARWHAPRDGQVPEVTAAAEALQAAGTSQWRDRGRQAAAHPRRRNARGWHHAGGNVWRFVADPRVAPTTNRAARARRPAVIARTVSPCATNTGGADAFAAFTRVIRTLMQTGVGSVGDALAQRFHPTQPQHLPT